MARIWVDDLDGKSPAVRTVTFPFEGDLYEVDLSAENLDRFQQALEPFFVNARKLGPFIAPEIPLHTAAATAVPSVSTPVPQALPESVTTAPVADSPRRPVPTVPKVTVTAAPPVPSPEAEAEPEPEPDHHPRLEAVAEIAHPEVAQPEVARVPAPEPEPESVGLFATVRFDPEPERELALVGAPAAPNGATRPAPVAPKVVFTRTDLPTAPDLTAAAADNSSALFTDGKLTDRGRKELRTWQDKHPVYKHRARHGRVPHDILQAFIAHLSDPSSGKAVR